MSNIRLSKSWIEQPSANMFRNSNFDHVRLGDSFTGINNNVVGDPDGDGVEYLERWYFHAKGGATFRIDQTQPDFDERWDYHNEIGNFNNAMKIEVTGAGGALAVDDYYLVETYVDGGDALNLNAGAGTHDPNFLATDPQEKDTAGAMMVSWWMRTNYDTTGGPTEPGRLAFHFSMIEEHNSDIFVGGTFAITPFGNFGTSDGWLKYSGFWRAKPLLGITGGNQLPTLAPGRRLFRWGLGLSGGTNYRLPSVNDESQWLGVGSDTTQRFLPTGNTFAVEEFHENAGNFIEISRPYFESGTGPGRINHLPWSLERQLCDRYLQTSYQDGVTPGTAAAAGGRVVQHSSGHSNSGYTLRHYVRLNQPMVSSPTVTVYSPTTGTANRVEMDGVDVTPNSIEVFEDGFIVEATAGAATTRNMEFHFVAKAELT